MTAAAKSQERTGWELEMQTWPKATQMESLMSRASASVSMLAKVTASASGLA
jgi:hypothetical protein